ncbi:DUF3261 domain-containing protein [Parvibaculum sp.]|uniref:DUF3261 domain-containing protein n=1 Tax=Parvibaculum sp. TaxID=2024848 RepID=UPI001B16B340|nr:DUF3261 domain-containing protein [Parvibaculum sp.]MBO6634137.1 DUF3261 domain-containing protein [Parvibaculum sp.]MBO6677203.1 DUF3261 domain-containing protein [Parvibaculum sp.]MBO6685046.1 DUF3261 domain-containing protein [Parvibaculum sp.]
MRISLVALLGVIVLSGCVGTQDALPVREELAPGVFLTLPEAQPFGPGVAATQLVEANYASRRDRFQANIETSSARFVLAMTVLSGPQLMTIEWHEGALVVRRGVVPAALDAERILADFMFVYAEEAALRKAVSGGDLVVSGSGARRVFRNGELLVEAVRPGGNPWEGEARLVNFVYDYELLITSHSASPQ